MSYRRSVLKFEFEFLNDFDIPTSENMYQCIRVRAVCMSGIRVIYILYYI